MFEGSEEILLWGIGSVYDRVEDRYGRWPAFFVGLVMAAGLVAGLTALIIVTLR